MQESSDDDNKKISNVSNIVPSEKTEQESMPKTTDVPVIHDEPQVVA